MSRAAAAVGAIVGWSAARRVGAAIRLSSSVSLPQAKATTGLTGLNVVPNAREVLIKLYEKTLRDIQVSFVTGYALPVALLAPAANNKQHNAGVIRGPCVLALSLQVIPPTVAYRLAVEAFTTFRLGVVRDNADVSVR